MFRESNEMQSLITKLHRVAENFEIDASKFMPLRSVFNGNERETFLYPNILIVRGQERLEPLAATIILRRIGEVNSLKAVLPSLQESLQMTCSEQAKPFRDSALRDREIYSFWNNLMLVRKRGSNEVAELLGGTVESKNELFPTQEVLSIDGKIADEYNPTYERVQKIYYPGPTLQKEMPTKGGYFTLTFAGVIPLDNDLKQSNDIPEGVPTGHFILRNDAKDGFYFLKSAIERNYAGKLDLDSSLKECWDSDKMLLPIISSTNPKR